MFVHNTVKYEVVIAIPNGINIIDGRRIDNKDLAKKAWMEYAKEYYDKTGVYVSAIVNEGAALYNKEWGCPEYGEFVLTFNCTMNPKFINDSDMYREGVLYITKKLKEKYNQNTVTITKIDSNGVAIIYLTNEENK